MEMSTNYSEFRNTFDRELELNDSTVWTTPMDMSTNYPDLRNTFVRELELNDSTVLNIHQLEEGDAGCVVWDAALVLTKYLEKSQLLTGKRILELGSGTGVVGLYCSYNPDTQVVITDLPKLVPLMELNIEKNRHNLLGNITAESLTWGEDISHFKPPVDIVLVADCVYYQESINPLIQTINDLSDTNTVVFCAYEDRDIGNKSQMQVYFRTQLEKNFTIYEIPSLDMDILYQSEDIHILSMIKN